MEIWEYPLLALGLSMDAFAVSVCKGVALKRATPRNCLTCGAWFGSFQALMPLLGYALAFLFAAVIENFDHWIAFGLLAIIGINMLKEAFSNEEESADDDMRFKTMLLLALATSIDAMAAGFTLALPNVNIPVAVALIGVFTFALSAVGVKIGNAVGNRFEKKAQIAGGAILIFLGLKILVEHLLRHSGVIS